MVSDFVGTQANLHDESMRDRTWLLPTGCRLGSPRRCDLTCPHAADTILLTLVDVGDETECKLLLGFVRSARLVSVFVWLALFEQSLCDHSLDEPVVSRMWEHLQRIEGLDDTWQNVGLTLICDHAL